MTDYTPPPAPISQSAASSLESVLQFVKHPGTNTGLGVALAGLSSFTAAVPMKERGSSTIVGLAYALATQLIDWLKSRP